MLKLGPSKDNDVSAMNCGVLVCRSPVPEVKNKEGINEVVLGFALSILKIIPPLCSLTVCKT